jgi:hypothetical protein
MLSDLVSNICLFYTYVLTFWTYHVSKKFWILEYQNCKFLKSKIPPYFLIWKTVKTPNFKSPNNKNTPDRKLQTFLVSLIFKIHISIFGLTTNLRTFVSKNTKTAILIWSYENQDSPPRPLFFKTVNKKYKYKKI